MLLTSSAADKAKVVADFRERIVDEEALPPQDIDVLPLHILGRKRSAVGENPGKYEYVHRPSTSADEVQFSSIRAMKGLEHSDVLVCGMDQIAH